jgi:hypothetical protein
VLQALHPAPALDVLDSQRLNYTFNGLTRIIPIRASATCDHPPECRPSQRIVRRLSMHQLSEHAAQSPVRVTVAVVQPNRQRQCGWRLSYCRFNYHTGSDVTTEPVTLKLKFGKHPPAQLNGVALTMNGRPSSVVALLLVGIHATCLSPIFNLAALPQITILGLHTMRNQRVHGQQAGRWDVRQVKRTRVTVRHKD